jgi:SPP1 gp7 family putative phage head morphogenesis protein
VNLSFDAPFSPSQPRINPLSVDVPEIIEWIEDKWPRVIDNWNELGAEEYARSFTVARATQTDIITDLYEGLLDEIRSGESTEGGYVKRMLPVLRAKGWLPNEDDKALGSRLALIYDTNLRTSQAVGKWRSFQRSKQYLPYLRYSAVGDRRTRPSHAALHGTILPVDDPFWKEAFPPCGFGCRCVVTGLTRSVALRRGGLTDPMEGQERIARAKALARGPGDFWGYNVGILADQAAVAQVQRVNERRLEGAPPVRDTLEEGRSVWASLFGGAIQRLLDSLGD